MNITETTEPKTIKRHVLLAIRNGQPTIVQVFGPVDSPGAWGQAIDAHGRLEDERYAAGINPRELHHAVRDSDHELVQAAAEAEAKALGSRQREVLAALALATPSGKSIKPGSRKMDSPDPRRWNTAAAKVGMANTYTGDIAAPARKLAAKGYLTIQGLDFAPKTYTVTPKGRLIAAAL